jgi:hypothetical protein
MKAFRTLVICCLLLVGASGLSGCATTEHADAASKAAESKEWDDLTTAQKIGCYLWWPFQWALFFGAEAAASR